MFTWTTTHRVLEVGMAFQLDHERLDVGVHGPHHPAVPAHHWTTNLYQLQHHCTCFTVFVRSNPPVN